MPDNVIEKLSDRDHVRLRFGMYIGDSSAAGLHQLVYELIDNSLDEVVAGFASRIAVTIHSDGSVSVEDDGQGIPVDRHEQLSEQQGRDVSTLEAVMTNLNMERRHKPFGSLRGIGLKAVNFLSHWCQVTSCRDGVIYEQAFEAGVPLGSLKPLGATNKCGTKITFKPDADIFITTKFQHEVLQERLRELAFLNRGLRITLIDERNDFEEEHCYEHGIVEYVEHLNRANDVLHPEVIYHKAESEGIRMEIALQYSNVDTEALLSFVNNIRVDAGTHVVGFRTAFTRTLNNYGKKECLLRSLIPTGDELREGLTAVVAVRVPDARFQGATRNRLQNPEVGGIVNSTFGKFLGNFLEENPSLAKNIVRNALRVAESRVAAHRAKAASLH